MICPNCNKEIPNGSIFCNLCGHKLDTNKKGSNSQIIKKQIKFSSINLELKKRAVKVLIFFSCLVVMVIIGINIIPNILLTNQYNKAVNSIQEGDFTEACAVLLEIETKNSEYRDINTLSLFTQAKMLYENSEEAEKYKEPLKLLGKIENDYSGVFRNSIDEMIETLMKEKEDYLEAEREKAEEERKLEEKKEQLAKEKQERLERQKKEQEENKFYEEWGDCPLEMKYVHISNNSIGTPELSVTAKNISNKTIDAFNVWFYCYDNFNKPVNHYIDNENIYRGIAQKTITPGNSFNGNNNHWTAYNFDNTTKFIAFITEVHFTDNTTWEMSETSFQYAKKYADENIEDVTFN